MTKLGKIKESLSKAFKLSEKIANQEPPKEIPITSGETDGHMQRRIDKIMSMTPEERKKFHKFQCDISAGMTWEEEREHAAELDAKIDEYLGI